MNINPKENIVSYSTDGVNIITQIIGGNTLHFLKTDRVIDIVRIFTKEELFSLGVNPQNLKEKYEFCRNNNFAVYNIFDNNVYNLRFGDVIEFKVVETLNQDKVNSKLYKYL